MWADPGAGKTSITLAAYCALAHDAGVEHDPLPTMLVVAPLRVCQLVWRQEALKWTQFKHLRIGLLHGPKKDDILKNRDQYDILLINYEGLDWLCDKFHARQLPFDIVAADELTKLKNHQSKRAKKLRKATQRTPFKWGLTGTPVPNGYMDLFGQFLWLDPAILGGYITHFRDQYFKAGYTGFDYTLQAGADARIEKRIENNVFRLAYDAMPARDVPIYIEFDKKSLIKYRELKKEMLLELPEGVITTANAAGVQQKLEQLANGAVYLRPGEPEYAVVHDLKLDALAELIEEMNGQQILIAYQFEHDLKRIQARFPDIAVLRGNERQVQQFEDDWNAGKIQALLVHPASVGHGLNLQKSSARHICWFSATFNLEHWDQLIRRLRRQGSNAKKIMNHILVVKGTVDELKLEVLSDKDSGQARLLQGFVRLLSEDTNDTDLRRPCGGVAQRGPSSRGDDVPDAGTDSRAEIRAADDDSGEGSVSEHDALLRGAAEAGDRRGLPQDHEQRNPDNGDNQGDEPMSTGGFRRLPRNDEAEQEQAAAPAGPKGWAPRGGATQAAAPAANRDAIRERVAAPARQPAPEQEQPEPAADPAPANGRGFFSRTVQAELGGASEAAEQVSDTAVEAQPVAEKVTRTHTPRAVKQKTADVSETIKAGATFGDTIAAVSGAHVEVKFYGDAAAVKAAMRAFLAA